MAATDFETAVSQAIVSSNQLHDVVNGTALETVDTDSGEIPTIRKAIADSSFFIAPIPWEDGVDETNLFQTRSFESGTYWAPSATTVNPVPMGSTPIGDNNWFLAPVNLTEEFVRDVSAKTFPYKGVVYKGIGNISDYVGGMLTEVVRFNSYQYPSDSGYWYGVKEGETFPVTIPADPSSDDKWDEVSGLTTDSLPLYTDIVYKASGGNSAVENMIQNSGLGEMCSCENGSTFQRISMISGDITDFKPINHPRVRDFGWDESGGEENYNILASFVNGGFSTNSFDRIYSINYFFTQWVAGNNFPIAFYGDSTTDGATTIGHVPSVIENGNANVWSNGVTINASPNAYPTKLEEALKDIAGQSLPIKCYNAGFDSQSLIDGEGAVSNFGNKAFHRVFFGYPTLNNVDFSDVKGIILSWGTSDSSNQDDINSVLDSYEWKMELLIIECFERGIQPFIAHPTYVNQRVGSLASGRNNYESVSVIEAINNKLAAKYNIETFSLRVPIETYVENAYPNLDNTSVYGARGDFGEVTKILPDGVHPYDKGHRMIASYYASMICPLIKSMQGHEVYKFTAGSIWPFVNPTFSNDDILGLVDSSSLLTRSTYFHKYSTTQPSSVCYQLFIYCEKPMDLTYSMLSIAGKSRDTSNYPRVDISSSVEQYGIFRPLESDYLSAHQSSQSHQLIGRLNVGLNTVSVTSAQVTINDNSFGFLRAEPMYEGNKVEFNNTGSALTRFVNSYPDMSEMATSLFTKWSSKKLNRENYALGGLNSNARRITFTANTLNGRDILFNAARNFVDFDTYDFVRCYGSTVELYNVTSAQLGAKTETLVGSAVSSFDFSSGADDVFSFNIQTSISDTRFYLQRVNKITGQVENVAGPIIMTSDSISSGGYSIGVRKVSTDLLPTLITNITDEFTH